MKLLDKQSLMQQKSTERKLEIDEAVKLAKKVDALRETSASEESRLLKFRQESLKQTKLEIDGLIAQKTELEGKVSTLEAQRTELLKPLDAEWVKVQEKQAKLSELEGLLEKETLKLVNAEIEIESRLRELKTEESRIKDKEKATDDNYSDSLSDRFDAGKILIAAKELESEIKWVANIKNAELLVRENSVAIRERNTEIRTESLEKREIEQNNRERAINDKYETLQRTIKRLK
jgi:hypothetical protein